VEVRLRIIIGKGFKRSRYSLSLESAEKTGSKVSCMLVRGEKYSRCCQCPGNGASGCGRGDDGRYVQIFTFVLSVEEAWENSVCAHRTHTHTHTLETFRPLSTLCTHIY